MAFTNIWDDTFPADTELANLIGANLRQLRLDIQQRMAVISGLSTSMPAFASDAQPGNWTGVLFFATDNGNIYQFNGTTWNNVTADFLPTTPQLFLGYYGSLFTSITNFLSFSGLPSSTEVDTQQVMVGSGVFNNLFVRISGTQPSSGSLVITLRNNGNSQALQVIIPAGSTAGTFSNTSAQVGYSQGNLVNFEIQNNATATSAIIVSIGMQY